jgi:hypothetical protein
VAICGRGEAAELAYLSLKESGLDPVAVFDSEGGGEFLGMAVRPLAEHAAVDYDLIIVATLDPTSTRLTELLNAGVPETKLYPLRRQEVPIKKARPATRRNGKSTNGDHK